MVFTIGDLIILGLVTLVLVIYRQLDSKNRSLEKVKRLGDKLMGDIEALTQDKVAQIKDMSIEVDVHQQTSKAAIERLATAEAHLNERSASMDEMQQRLDAYDNALRELITMTQKAEENITRLRDESVYIDKVGRRIRQAGGQLQQLEDRIPQMLGQFETANRNHLVAMGDQVVETVQSRLANLEGQLDMSNQAAAESIQRMRGEIAEAQQDLAAKVDAYRRAFDAIEQDYHARLEEVAHKGLALETESLKEMSATITGQIDERYRLLRDQIEQNQQAVSSETDRMHSRIEGMQGDLDVWEQEMRLRHEQALDHATQRNGEQAANLEAAIQALSALFQNAQAGLIGELKLTQDRTSDKLAEVQGGIRHAIDASRSQLELEISQARQEFEAWQRDLQDSRQETEAELRRNMADSRDSLEADLLATGKQLELVRHDLEAQIADARQENLRSLDDFQEGMQGRAENLESGIYQLENDLAGKLAGVQEKAQTLADHLLMRMNQDVDAKTESMREAINQRVEQVNASVEASHRQIDVSFSELRGRVDEWIGASQAYMTQLDEQVKTLNEESRNANQEHRATIETHIAETQERLNSYERGLTARVGGLEESITRAEDLVQNQFDRLLVRADELAKETGADLDGRYQRIRTDLQTHFGEQFGLVQAEIEQGRNHLETLAEQTRERVIELRGQLDERLAELESGGRERGVALDLAFERQVNELGTTLASRLESEQSQLSGKIDAQVQELRNLVRENHLSLEQAKDNQQQLDAGQIELAGRIKDHRQLISKELEELRQVAAQGQTELLRSTQASLNQSQADMSSQLDEHAALMAKRIQLAGQELTDQAKTVQADLGQWRDGLMRQIDELRTLGQGLHQDTIGSIQTSITTVQKQAQDLFNRINHEIAGSLAQHEEKILGLTTSSEGDLRRLQALTLETQGRISAWQDTLVRTESDIGRDIQEIRENTRILAQKGNEELLAQLKKRQDEVGLVLDETMSKLKSDINHSKGDIEQDIGFLQQQIDQWKGNFQEHLKALQESSRKIEEQALVGLSERIDTLSEEARQLTRKAQDEFSTAINQHQTQIQAQLEIYNNDLRRVQGLNKEIQGQIVEMDGELGRTRTMVKDSLGEVQSETRRQAEALKDALHKEIATQHQGLSELVKQASDAMAADIGADKSHLERELALIQIGRAHV